MAAVNVGPLSARFLLLNWRIMINPSLPPKLQAQVVGGSPILMLIRTRFWEFIRKPEAVFWTYGFPLLMVIVLGSAFRAQAVEPLRVAVQDLPGHQRLVEMLSPESQLLIEVATPSDSRRLLRSGKVSVVVVPDQTVRESGMDNQSLHQNGTLGNPADVGAPEILVDYARPGSQLAELTVERQLQIAAGQQTLVPIKSTKFDEPGSRYIDFLVPGLIGMSLLGGGMWGVGYAIVDLRIRKLLKRFLATPMRRRDFLLGVVCSRLCFMLPEIALMLVFTSIVFSVTVYGSWLAVIFLVFLGGIQFSGIGLLVASRAKTIETVSGLMNLVMLPMWTLSGIFFSYENFPEFLHWPIRLLPLTPLLDALRGVMLDGKPLTALGFEITMMSVWAVAAFVIALKIFRWTDQ